MLTRRRAKAEDGLGVALTLGTFAVVEPAGVLAASDAEQCGDVEDALEAAVVASWAAEGAADLA